MTSSFDSFLSPELRHLFGEQDDILQTPVVERFPGAVLLVDVSGWTKLVHELSSRGPEGVERLTQALNAHLGGGSSRRFTRTAARWKNSRVTQMLALHVGVAGGALAAVSGHAHATRYHS